jgi:hypothetical protein
MLQFGTFMYVVTVLQFSKCPYRWLICKVHIRRLHECMALNRAGTAGDGQCGRDADEVERSERSSGAAEGVLHSVRGCCRGGWEPLETLPVFRAWTAVHGGLGW